MILEAYTIAKIAHHGQEYDGHPYFSRHVMDVANRVRRDVDGLDLSTDEHVSTAYLHDVLEDTHVTAYDMLMLGIPNRVVLAVEALTRDPGDDYLDYIASQVMADEIAVIVKWHDLGSNMSSNVGKPEQESRMLRYRHARKILEPRYLSLTGRNI